jgi:ferrochelatase
MKNQYKKHNKTGVLLVNLGTPDSTSVPDVKKYLREFLSDRRVIELHPMLWTLILNGFILPFRSPKTAKLYKAIWRKEDNMSPLFYYTERQAALLCEIIPDHFLLDFAMRYGTPSIEVKLKALHKQGATDIKILPLYPQYSSTTTATVYDEVYRILSKMRWQPNIIGIKPYYDHPDYIQLLKQQVLAHAKSLSFTADALVVSFHGIPKSYFEKGDPYYCHCHKTYRLLKESLDGEFLGDVTLSFQSRFGPKEWLEPYTTDVLAQCAKGKAQKIMVIAPGFSADCLETLEELQVTEKDAFMRQGGQKYTVVPCLNDSVEHIKFLKKLVV